MAKQVVVCVCRRCHKLGLSPVHTHEFGFSAFCFFFFEVGECPVLVHTLSLSLPRCVWGGGVLNGIVPSLLRISPARTRKLGKREESFVPEVQAGTNVSGSAQGQCKLGKR